MKLAKIVRKQVGCSLHTSKFNNHKKFIFSSSGHGIAFSPSHTINFCQLQMYTAFHKNQKKVCYMKNIAKNNIHNLCACIKE